MKTPYVADVQLTDGTMVLAHAPAMDCAGMITPASQVHMTVNNFKDDGRVRTTHAIQVSSTCRHLISTKNDTYGVQRSCLMQARSNAARCSSCCSNDCHIQRCQRSQAIQASMRLRCCKQRHPNALPTNRCYSMHCAYTDAHQA